MKSEKVKKRIRIGPVGEAILVSVGIAGLFTVAVLAPNAFQMFAPMFKKRKKVQKQEVRRNIESLVRSGLVKQSVDAKGNFTFALTMRGKWEVALRHRTFEQNDKKQWDKKWRVIIFDIPNSQSSIRGELRKAMLLYGFRMLQKSVWVYPYPCDSFIVLLRSHLKIKSNVLYMTVDMIENDRELRKEFDIH